MKELAVHDVSRVKLRRSAGLSVALFASTLLGCTGEISGDSGTSPVLPGPPGPGPGPGIVTPPVGDDGAPLTLLPPRVWRLTHEQFKNSLIEVFGYAGPTADEFPEDGRLEFGYRNAADHLAVSPTLSGYYMRATEEVAANVLTRASEFIAPCTVETLGGSACLTAFITTTGQKAWRRPLSAEEQGRLSALHAKVLLESGGELAFTTLIQALILSPNFVFRTELGQTQVGTTELTEYELASALSYLLWDGPPDEALMAAAAAGQLRTEEGRVAQAQRMWQDVNRSRTALNEFVENWLNSSLKMVQKDEATFERFSPELMADYQAESERFINDVVFQGAAGGNLTGLLTAPFGYATERSAEVYGVTVQGTDLVQVQLDPAQRRGILTQGAFLTANSYSDSTGPVSRGLFIRETLLCSPVPQPPPVPLNEALFGDDSMTAREKLELHRTEPSCSSCHAVFDPIGLSLENYDGIGEYRTTEVGKPIDPSGELPLPTGKVLNFENFVSLVDQLVQEPVLYDCFAKQFLMYATGRTENQLNEERAHDVAAAFTASQYKLDALVTAVVKSPYFVSRQN